MEKFLKSMNRIKHRFINHCISPSTETLVIGTFNPETIENTADFFYGRPRNFLWVLIPRAFNIDSLKELSLSHKLEFIKNYRIDFIDLIKEVEVEEVANYNDNYLDNRVSEWRDIISEIQKLRNLKRICLTRRTFGGIPNMKMKIDEIKSYCLEKQIPFLLLTTPSRFYNQSKQTEWTAFFNSDK